jgi:pyruvate formate lyase activating enzyme
MNIGGFLSLSLCDYPGKVAAVVFSNGCNFHCPWCHNGHLLRGAADPDYHEIPEDEILSRLGELKNRLQGVVVTGGEPTIQPDLRDFISRIKALGLLVKLDTNGSNPDVVRDLVGAGLVDFIAMDVKAPWAKYGILTGLAESPADKVRETMSVIVASRLPHQFRTTRVTPLLTDEDCAEIERQIPAGSPFKWQTFIPDNALDPALRKQ